MISLVLRYLSVPRMQPYEHTPSQRSSHETESSGSQLSEGSKFLKRMRNASSQMTNLCFHGGACCRWNYYFPSKLVMYMLILWMLDIVSMVLQASTNVF